MTDQLIEYRSSVPGREPACEVLVDGEWREGFVRGWFRYADGWKASVEYSTPAETRSGTTFPSNHLATFDADQVRKVESPG